MNERIKELVGKALDQAVSYTWTSLMPHELNNFAEKFAELIVRECAEKCLDMKYVDPQPHHYAVMLKEHFGVEE